MNEINISMIFSRIISRNLCMGEICLFDWHNAEISKRIMTETHFRLQFYLLFSTISFHLSCGVVGFLHLTSGLVLSRQNYRKINWIFAIYENWGVTEKIHQQAFKLRNCHLFRAIVVATEILQKNRAYTFFNRLKTFLSSKTCTISLCIFAENVYSKTSNNELLNELEMEIVKNPLSSSLETKLLVFFNWRLHFASLLVRKHENWKTEEFSRTWKNRRNVLCKFTQFQRHLHLSVPGELRFWL